MRVMFFNYSSLILGGIVIYVAVALKVGEVGRHPHALWERTPHDETASSG